MTERIDFSDKMANLAKDSADRAAVAFAVYDTIKAGDQRWYSTPELQGAYAVAEGRHDMLTMQTITKELTARRLSGESMARKAR